ncbi:hypothetical protein LTR15_004462 [Elasticomyces elasticus]|nr:hypothetical protein LTR15_004462 [Elasticomyces elasticus]
METESTRDDLNGDGGAREAPDQVVDEKHAVSVSASIARPSTVHAGIRPELKPYEADHPGTQSRTAIVGPQNNIDINEIPEVVTDASADSVPVTSTPPPYAAGRDQRASEPSLSSQANGGNPSYNPFRTKLDSRRRDQNFQDGLSTPPRRQPSVEAILEEMTVETQMRQLFDAGKSVVFNTTHSRGNKNAPKTSTLNIAALQQMNLHYLQYRIACHVGRSFDEGTFVAHLELEEPALPIEYRLDRLDYWMERYCQAVRDMEYMKERATVNPSEDPFRIMSSRAVERWIMETVGLIPEHLIPAGKLPNALDHEEPALHINSRVMAKKEEAREQNLRRLGMAAIGGLLLLVPVLIMANLPGKIATLVTTSASMVVFAVLVTLGTDLGPNEVLATTAGYAAVLVVFVGTSLAPQAGNSC